jgi:hypothetical protein
MTPGIDGDAGRRPAVSGRPRLKCPKCGAEMNHHADKLVAPTDGVEPSGIDLVLGGVIQETHACPACANVEFRRASA